MNIILILNNFDASLIERKERSGSICHAAREKVWNARRIFLLGYCGVLGVDIGRSILSQLEEELASGGDCSVLVGLLVAPF